MAIYARQFSHQSLFRTGLKTPQILKWLKAKGISIPEDNKVVKEWMEAHGSIENLVADYPLTDQDRERIRDAGAAKHLNEFLVVDNWPRRGYRLEKRKGSVSGEMEYRLVPLLTPQADRDSGGDQAEGVVVKHIALGAVRTDGETQTRPSLIESSVLGCMERIQVADDIPPVEVVQDGSTYWLWDGFHRYEANRRLKRETIMANVRKGTLDDARWLAASANKASDPHIVGNQRSEATKRACVLLALRQRPNLSDGVIAKHVGCSTRYVGMVRAEAGVNTSDLPDSPRLARDGKKYKVKRKDPEAEAQDLIAKGEPVRKIAEKTGKSKSAVQRIKDQMGGNIGTTRGTKKPSQSAIQPCPLGLDQEVEERIAAVLDRINRAVGDLLDEPKRRELVAFIERLVRS